MNSNSALRSKPALTKDDFRSDPETDPADGSIKEHGHFCRQRVSFPSKDQIVPHQEGNALYVHKRRNSGARGQLTISTRGVAVSTTLAVLATSVLC
jgi:hypothetical protein